MSRDCVFNKVFYELVKELKKLSPALKDIIRLTYKVKFVGDENVKFFRANFYETLNVNADCCPLDDTTVEDVELLKNVSLKLIKLHISGDDQSVVNKYIYTLSILDRASDDDTFQLVAQVLGDIQKGGSYNAENVIDDDLIVLFEKLSKLSRSTKHLPPFLENTMIGTLAQELTEEIDIASLGISKPEDLLTNSSGLGNVIGKITDKLQGKIATGSLDPALLMKEAFSLVSSEQPGMFSNPIFADILKNMMNNQSNPGQSGSPMKTKLQNKLAVRKNQSK